jgi:DnaJ-class molecular chaperone
VAKKIENMDFYDLLNLRLDASQKEIENAYQLAVATYHEEALASYGVLSTEERRLILEKIEEAFQTLANPETRKAYNSAIQASRPEFQQKAYFRKSTEKLEIEDASKEGKFWDRIKSLLIPPWRRKKKENHKDKKDEKDWLTLESDHYYYGEYLKRIREIRGISLEQIAKDCKISLSSLRALEEEDYDSLPNGKDFHRLLRLYARCLGLDSDNGRE